MSVENGFIVKPLSVTDVKQVLGVASNDVGYLCGNGHGKVNMWSKCKPVRLTSAMPDRETEWWKGENEQCGYSVFYCTSDDADRAFNEILHDLSLLDWSYGFTPNGSTYPYRLADFDGYNHNAVAPFDTKSIDYSFSQNAGSGSTILLGINEGAYDVDGNFTPEMLSIEGSSCSDWYYGIMITDETGVPVACVTMDKTVANSKGSLGGIYESVYFSPSLINTGTYKVFNIMSNQKKYGSDGVYYQQGETWSGGKIVVLPIQPGTLSITSYGEANIYYTVYTTDNSVNLQLYGTNKTGSGIKLEAISTKIEYLVDREDVYDWATLYDMGEEVVEDTIPANTEKYEFRVGGSLSKSQIGWVTANRYRISVEAAWQSNISGSVTEFWDDGDVYGE